MKIYKVYIEIMKIDANETLIPYGSMIQMLFLSTLLLCKNLQSLDNK